MINYFRITILISLLTATHAYSGVIDISEIWNQIVWCGSNGDKALICHGAGGKKLQQLCVSLNALKRGHLTAESGVTRLHGDDYFGVCQETPVVETLIFPCNAAIKSPQQNNECTIIGDSLSCGDSSLDLMTAEVTMAAQEISTSSIFDDQINLSIPTHPSVYQELSSVPFATQLVDDSLRFNLHSEMYGTAYSVDWCIRQLNFSDRFIDFSLNFSDFEYLNRAETVTRFELWCGDSANSLQKIEQSSTVPLNQNIQYQSVSLPARSHCLWRQKIFETRQGKRPWKQDNLLITGTLNSY